VKKSCGKVGVTGVSDLIPYQSGVRSVVHLPVGGTGVSPTFF